MFYLQVDLLLVSRNGGGGVNSLSSSIARRPLFFVLPDHTTTTTTTFLGSHVCPTMLGRWFWPRGKDGREGEGERERERGLWIPVLRGNVRPF